MANKKFWIGMLVMALVFGMSVIGCDNDGAANDTTNGQYGLNGPWVNRVFHNTQFVFSGNSYRYQGLGLGSNWLDLEAGSFSIAGEQIHFNRTHHTSWNNYEWVLVELENIYSYSYSRSFSREGQNTIWIGGAPYIRN